MASNLQVLLDHRPTDKVSPANFRLVETPVPTPGPGEVLVRHSFLSLDPYMRGRLSDAKSYAKPQEVGAVMGGGTVGVVEASNNPRFHPGDAVVGMGGWQRYSLSDGASLRVVDAKAIPIQAYLGPVGMPGVTAWYGLNKIIAPKAGETVLVSAATGAVGSVVGQLAKLAGARTVGIAGGPEKCAYAAKELGYDACGRSQIAEFRRGSEGGAAGRGRRAVRERRRRAVPAGDAAAQRFRPGRDLRRSSPRTRARRPRCPTCGIVPRQALQDGGFHRLATIWTCGRRRSANWSVSSPPRN